MQTTNTDLSFNVSTSPAPASARVMFVVEGINLVAPHVGFDEDQDCVDRLMEAGAAKGSLREVVVHYVDANGAMEVVLLVGLGKPEKLNAESVRRAGGALLRTCRKLKLKQVAMKVLPTPSMADTEFADAVVTGTLLADFSFREYKGSKKADEQDDAERSKIDMTIVVDSSRVKEMTQATERARKIADAQNFARTIASRPGNVINPLSLAKVAQAMAKDVGLTCRVLDEKQMEKLGMGGILAVGAGSQSTPPRMIVLEWDGGSKKTTGKGKKRQPLLVVGKAVTFDTGGISIKSADKMGKMIYDKCGGMTVLGVMQAVASLKLPVRVVGILGAAENHISELAFRPGDILTMYNGVTVEVTNTDAEGRLVLGDALAWGIETYDPAAVIDLATLTGGVRVALGTTMAGVMGNDDSLIECLGALGTACGEKMWRLPVGEEQREQIKSDHADIVNSAGRDAHPLQGGAFLSFFVPENLPWAHLDIAAVADTEKDLPYYGKGATGWGVRTLVEWIDASSSK